jgi:hypothetical protein
VSNNLVDHLLYLFEKKTRNGTNDAIDAENAAEQQR